MFRIVQERLELNCSSSECFNHLTGKAYLFYLGRNILSVHPDPQGKLVLLELDGIIPIKLGKEAGKDCICKRQGWLL
jgi:hypothetical protein